MLFFSNNISINKNDNQVSDTCSYEPLVYVVSLHLSCCGLIGGVVGCHQMVDLFTISVFHDITEILLDVTLNTYDP
jgi:hypothetical protein